MEIYLVAIFFISLFLIVEIRSSQKQREIEDKYNKAMNKLEGWQAFKFMMMTKKSHIKRIHTVSKILTGMKKNYSNNIEKLNYKLAVEAGHNVPEGWYLTGKSSYENLFHRIWVFKESDTWKVRYHDKGGNTKVIPDNLYLLDAFQEANKVLVSGKVIGAKINTL